MEVNSEAQTPGTVIVKRSATGGLTVFMVFLILALMIYEQVRAVQKIEPAPKLTPPVQWEYKLTAIADERFPDLMNALGADGWELVSARRASSDAEISASTTFSYEMIFKRQRQK